MTETTTKGKVFWHGLWPDISRQGVIIPPRGTLNHEVRWDSGNTSFVPVACLMLVSKWGKCCAYCASVKQRRT